MNCRQNMADDNFTLFVQHEILLAHKLVLVDDVELIAGRDELTAHRTREAVYVEYFIERVTH